MSLRITTAIAAATVGALGLTAPTFAEGEGSCCDTSTVAQKTEGCTESKDTTFIAVEKSADELFADFTAITQPDIDVEKYRADEEYRNSDEVKAAIDKFYADKAAAADAFVAAYPADERSLPLIATIMQLDADADMSKYVALLNEHHAENPASKQIITQIEAKQKLAEAVGKPFELEFTDAVSGETINVQNDLDGKVVVIDFWATWCGPCIAEMPNMKKLYAEYKDQGVEFIGISLDQEGDKEKLVNWVKDNDVAWPQYYQGNGWQSEFSKSWGINSIPRLFILDAQGNLHSTEARGELETMIPELIKQRDDNAQASAE